MGYSPSLPPYPASASSTSQSEQPKMSTLAMPTPSPHSGFKREYPWESSSSLHYRAQPRNEPGKVALPSIRQAFPEIHLRAQPQENPTRTASSTTSPTRGVPPALTPPEYVHSPISHKRRRLSSEDDLEATRGGFVPRHYHGPGASTQQPSPPPPAPRPGAESWAAPRPPLQTATTTAPYVPPVSYPPMQSPIPIEVQERQDPRPTLPSLPQMATFEREPIHPHHPPAPTHEPLHAARPLGPTGSFSVGVGVGGGGGGAGYPMGLHHANRGQSLSQPPVSQHTDRIPFSTVGYPSSHFSDMGPGGMGGMTMHGDNKQRKRRGNLPKETTDKLRAWFTSHLHHPYPTEDEKQELMRQTGLQMNQISNWFINARRRQMPAGSNSRTDSDAGRGNASATTSNSDVNGLLAPPSNRSEYGVDMHGKRSSVPLSDGESIRYDDDPERSQRRASSHGKRESI